jgi:thiamine pyrophosphate-dependent acetolactate synthase large subunit-like protein
LELSRHTAVSAILAALTADCTALFPTGYISREAFWVRDRPLNLYLVGSMGHVLPVGLGIALAQPDRTVVVVDGDGGALMGLSAFPMLGAEHRSHNIVHVVLDDGAYSSTGGQPTISRHGLLAQLATASGYPHVYTVEGAAGLQNRIRSSIHSSHGPVFVQARIFPDGREPAPRLPSPETLASRFRAAMSARPIVSQQH